MQLKLRDFLTTRKSLPYEIKRCRICTSNESYGSGYTVSGAAGGEFVIYVVFRTIAFFPRVAPLIISPCYNLIINSTSIITHIKGTSD